MAVLQASLDAFSEEFYLKIKGKTHCLGEPKPVLALPICIDVTIKICGLDI